MTLYKMLSIALLGVLVGGPAFASPGGGDASQPRPTDPGATGAPCVGSDCNAPAASPKTSAPPARPNDQSARARNARRDAAGTETQTPRGNTAPRRGERIEKNSDLNDTASNATGSIRCDVTFATSTWRSISRACC